MIGQSAENKWDIYMTFICIIYYVLYIIYAQYILYKHIHTQTYTHTLTHGSRNIVEVGAERI